VERPSPQLAGAVTARIWPMVALQWEWLGGAAPIRTAAVIGGGAWGTAMAVALRGAGVDVVLGCRTAEQAETLRAHGENRRYLPGVRLPPELAVARAADLDLTGRDLVVLAVPARALPAVTAAHGERIAAGAGVLVLSKGLVPPMATLPSAFVAERVPAGVACLGGPAHAADALANGAAVVLGAHDRALAKRIAEVLGRAGLDVQLTTDVTGVELAGVAKNAAVIAAAAAAGAGPNAAGAAAGRVFGEVDALAVRLGARRETLAGLAGVGDLVGTVVAAHSRNRRAGELLGAGTPAREIEPVLGHATEGLDALPLLAFSMDEQGLAAPAVRGLAAVLDGRVDPETWAAALTAPRGRRAA
jgi:glycerol-3-phosphate dehydrogenase